MQFYNVTYALERRQILDLKKHFKLGAYVCVFVWVHTCESAGAVETRRGIGCPAAGVVIIDSMSTSVGAWNRTQASNHVATFSIVQDRSVEPRLWILEMENLVLESVPL